MVVDDEQDLLQILTKRLIRKGFEVSGFLSGEEALQELKKNHYDIGIFDIKMPGIDGIELLHEVKKELPEIEVIILTGHGTIETAIEAMKAGAYDYLTKPYNLAELEVIIEKAMEKKRLFEENTRLKEVLQMEGSQFHLIGESPAFKNLLEMTRRIATSQVSVLIEGESGTGKELIARAIHAWSDRKDQPFIAINSGGLVENLLESELFGHVKGAFTGAQTDKKGLLEMADGGTIFFDEVGEMPLNLQVKLLRFFESNEFRRVGDHRLRYANVRVVAATNRNLKEEIKKGTFREDLYFRLNVVNIVTPPLRERKEDIPLLIKFFLKKRSFANQPKELSEKAYRFLQSYSFPGNIRELSHLIERGALLATGEQIEIENLFPHIVFEEKSEIESNNQLTLEQMEMKHIEKMLKQFDGNKTKAAEALGISLRSLYRKINEYEIT